LCYLKHLHSQVVLFVLSQNVVEPYTELIIKLVFKPFTNFDVASMMVLQVAVVGVVTVQLW